MKKIFVFFIVVCLFFSGIETTQAQTLERVVFSSVASNNDNFQPIAGTPYGTSLVGANGSLEVSAEYGQSTYEETTLSAKEMAEQSKIRVYPNPTSEFINIELSQIQSSGVLLLLVDINGKEVFRKTVISSIEVFDMKNYPAGTYLLQVEVSKTKVQTFRIIKSK